VIGGSLLLAALAIVGVPAPARAQTGFMSGGLTFDIRRYAADGEGPKVYDGQPPGGFIGAGVFMTQRFSIDFETSLSSDVTTSITTPVVIADSRSPREARLHAARCQPGSHSRTSMRGRPRYCAAGVGAAPPYSTYLHSAAGTPWYGATISNTPTNPNHYVLPGLWQLQTKDGTIYSFNDSEHLINPGCDITMHYVPNTKIINVMIMNFHNHNKTYVTPLLSLQHPP